MQLKIKLPIHNQNSAPVEPEPHVSQFGNGQTRPMAMGLRERLLARHIPVAARLAHANTLGGELIRFQDVHEVYNDSLQFWSKFSNSYPNLSAIARALFCVQATTATAESAFSFAGSVIRSRRAAIDPFRVEKVLFIHDNYDLFSMNA